MKEIKLFCDKCGKEVHHLNYYTFPGYKKDTTIAFYGETLITSVKADIEIEICDECAEKIRKEFNFHQN